MPQVEKPDTAVAQQCADTMRAGAVEFVEPFPEVAAMLTTGASVIENLLDLVSRQYKTIVEMSGE